MPYDELIGGSPDEVLDPKTENAFWGRVYEYVSTVDSTRIVCASGSREGSLLENCGLIRDALDRVREGRGERSSSTSRSAPAAPIQTVGIANVGNTCFIASGLQSLFTMENFRERIEQARSRGSISEALANALIRLYDNQVKGAFLSPERQRADILTVQDGLGLTRMRQDDAGVIINHLLERLDLTSDPHCSLWARGANPRKGGFDPHSEPFPVGLSFQNRREISLSQLFREGISENPAMQISGNSELQEIFISVDRDTGSFGMGQRILNPFETQRFASDENGSSMMMEATPVSFTCASGTGESGHYVAVFRQPDGSFILKDDSTIRPLTREEAFRYAEKATNIHFLVRKVDSSRPSASEDRPLRDVGSSSGIRRPVEGREALGLLQTVQTQIERGNLSDALIDFDRLPKEMRNAIFYHTYLLAKDAGIRTNHGNFGEVAFCRQHGYDVPPSIRIRAIQKYFAEQAMEEIQKGELEEGLAHFDRLPEAVRNATYGEIYQIEKGAGRRTGHRNFGKVAFRGQEGFSVSNDVRMDALLEAVKRI